MVYKWKSVVFMIIVICIMVIACILYNSHFEFEYRIFAHIDELNTLNDYIIDHAKDQNIGNIEYTRSFCYNLQYNGNEYVVCAYEFADPESSKLYYKNVWKEDFNYWTEWWSRSKSGLTGCEYLTFDGNRVLYFSTRAPHHKATEFENWLAQSLSIELPDHNTPIVPNENQMDKLQEMINDLQTK